MKKLLFTAVSVIAALSAVAQEFGAAEGKTKEPVQQEAEVEQADQSVNAGEPSDGSIIEKDQQVMDDEEPIPEPSVLDTLNKYIDEHEDKVTLGYDAKTDRIVVIERLDFDIEDPMISDNYLQVRNEKMSELILMAKAQIIEMMMSSMTGARMLEIPGNPVRDALEAKREKICLKLNKAKRQIVKLDEELKESATTKEDVNPSELLAVVSSMIKKTDEKNLAQKLDEDKKARYEAVKKNLAAARKEYEALCAEAENVKDQVASRMHSKTERISAMLIHGCTVLKQADHIIETKDGDFKYEIGIIYSWSAEMQEAARNILQGNEVAFKPGKNTVRGWLNKKAKSGSLARWCGPRKYIDKDGHMWFLGISSAPIGRSSIKNRKLQIIAEERAVSEVMFALYADASSRKATESLSETRSVGEDKSDTPVLNSVTAKLRESYKDLRVSGVAPVYRKEIIHPVTEKKILVIVYGLDSASANALSNIKENAMVIGAEINKAQEFMRGKDERLMKRYEASKYNAAARKAGADSADKKFADAAAKNQKKHSSAAGRKSSSREVVPSQRKGRLHSNQIFMDDDDDE